ncbi:MAG: PilZ domain-containing protein [Sphingomonadales bacterium]|nr:PilZ domain-containing protein [Sphingomonadales bacterium]MDE2568797.1 PilZ domain-containing protein [Sphingomonadales bacterium]
MTDLDHRQLGRDSLFLMADLRLGQAEGEHKVKVRNLSAGGMMAEGPVKVTRGAPVQVNLRNLGWVDGVVAWIQDNRFGIAFVEDVDPKSARAPVNSSASGGESGTPRFVRPPLGKFEAGRLRKI